MTSTRKTLWALIFLGLVTILAFRAYIQFEDSFADESLSNSPPVVADVDLSPLDPIPTWNSPSFQENLEVLKRPLFESTRLPPPKEIEVVGEISLQALEASLTGVIITDALRVIIIKDKEGNERRLQVGDEIGGWILEEIDVHEAQLIDVKGEERRTLSLVYRPVTTTNEPGQ